MAAYVPIHENFVRFCQARTYQISNYEDLVSESILRAFQAWDTIQKKNALLYFLFGTARNILMNTLRKKQEVGMEDASGFEYQENNAAN